MSLEAYILCKFIPPFFILSEKRERGFVSEFLNWKTITKQKKQVNFKDWG